MCRVPVFHEVNCFCSCWVTMLSLFFIPIPIGHRPCHVPMSTKNKGLLGLQGPPMHSSRRNPSKRAEKRRALFFPFEDQSDGNFTSKFKNPLSIQDTRIACIRLRFLGPPSPNPQPPPPPSIPTIRPQRISRCRYLHGPWAGAAAASCAPRCLLHRSRSRCFFRF